MKYGVALAAFLVVIVAGVGIFESANSKEAGKSHSFLLYDQSDTKIDGCTCIVEEAKRILAENSQTDQEIQFLSLGDVGSGFKPKPVMSIERKQRVSSFQKKDTAGGTFEDDLQRLKSACEAIPRTPYTPLYEAILVTVEELKVRCERSSNCSLIVQTDMEETIQANLLGTFNRKRQGNSSHDEPGTIDNTGIAVMFIGTEEVAFENSSLPDNVIEQKIGNSRAWRDVWTNTFTEPNLVKFRPLCTKARTR